MRQVRPEGEIELLGVFGVERTQVATFWEEIRMCCGHTYSPRNKNTQLPEIIYRRVLSVMQLGK